MILNRQRSVRIAIGPLEAFFRRVQAELGLAHAEVTVALVSDSEIARMNHTYRKKRGPTDVLSFPALESAGRKIKRRGALWLRSGQAESAKVRRGYLGDIAIAPAVARRNAMQLGRPLSSELRILILHGVLHLLGYDHEADRGAMERLEKRLQKKLGLS